MCNEVVTGKERLGKVKVLRILLETSSTNESNAEAEKLSEWVVTEARL